MKKIQKIKISFLTMFLSSFAVTNSITTNNIEINEINKTNNQQLKNVIENNCLCNFFAPNIITSQSICNKSKQILTYNDVIKQLNIKLNQIYPDVLTVKLDQENKKLINKINSINVIINTNSIDTDQILTSYKTSINLLHETNNNSINASNAHQQKIIITKSFKQLIEMLNNRTIKIRLPNDDQKKLHKDLKSILWKTFNSKFENTKFWNYHILKIINLKFYNPKQRLEPGKNVVLTAIKTNKLKKLFVTFEVDISPLQTFNYFLSKPTNAGISVTKSSIKKTTSK